MRVALSLAFVIVAVLLATVSSLSSEAGPSRSARQTPQPADETVQKVVDELAAWPFAGP